MDPVSQHIHLEDLPTPGSRFELQELLGEGTYSKVYAAQDKQKGDRVAVKIISDIAENILEIESEYRVLTSIGGQSIIPQFHGTYLHTPKNSKRQLWFVMELCDGLPVSELLAYYKREGKALQEEEIGSLLKSFMLGIHHLHQNDIICRDIRAGNFIISPSGDVKLIDFGSCALVKDSDGTTHASIGSPYWMAPEVIACEQQSPYSKACDVWSLGITAIELAESQPPLFDIHPVRAMFQIARNPPPQVKKVASWSEPFKDFISECLERNADNRPVILELICHPFITSCDDATNEDFSLEEHLNEDYVPALGSRAKQILKRLGEMMEANLYPIQPTKPMTVTVKNWHFKSDADSPHRKQLPDDLAAMEGVTEDSALDHLLHRFAQDEIYTYMGDILIALNPRNKLPLYDSKIQTQYWEKARSDNPPHVFAIADVAYQQMLHHKRSQVIILFGKCSSGKSFSATQIINHLAFLCPSGNVAMAEKMQQLCPLLDAFGSARTTYNCNASRLLKTFSLTFTKSGKTTGAIITATLLDRTRISNIPENESNFHILYYVYEGLKSEKRLAEFGLDKLSSMRYLPQKTAKNQGDLVAGYKAIFHALRTLSYTEEEILMTIRMLSAIMLLGDVTYTMKGTMAAANNPYLITTAAKMLSVDNDKLNNLIGKGAVVEEVESKRDSWVQFLYLRVFDWIVSSINKQLSFSRLVMGAAYSVTVIDPPGFGTTDPNQIFRLGINIIDDSLQNYMQQLMFFKELEEYKDDGVEIPFKYEDTIQQKESRDQLIESEKAFLAGLMDTESLKSLPSGYVDVGDETVTIHHIFEKMEYNIQGLQNENITLAEEPEFIETFQSTDDILTSAVASVQTEPTKSVAEEILSLIPKILDPMSADYPHMIICIQPTSCAREDIKCDPQYILQQLRSYNFMETITIRQQGFARRLSFADFLNWYKFLAFDFDEEVELNKENSTLLLIRLKMDGWTIGNDRVFLKYYSEEYLSRLYETYVKKLVKIQAMARGYIVKIRKRRAQ